MIRIALTGPTGSGKGFVCRMLEKNGIPCLDTDLVVHRIYDRESTRRALEERLGAELSNEKGGVDRKKLGALVYGDPEKMEALLAYVYPQVRRECRRFLTLREKKGCKAAVVDAPQLFEAGFENDYDLILCVTASAEERLKRIMERDGITEREALVRMSHQKSEEEYIARSDRVLYCESSEKTAKEVESLLRFLGYADE